MNISSTYFKILKAFGNKLSMCMEYNTEPIHKLKLY